MRDEDYKKLYQRRSIMMRQKIQREQLLNYENYKSSKLSSFSKEGMSADRILYRKKLLDYVNKYVFLQNLEPISFSEQRIAIESSRMLKEPFVVKNFLKNLLLIRDVLEKFVSLRFFFYVFAAFFFFSFEYYLRYYSSFSFNDVNITYESIISKIPPFF